MTWAAIHAYFADPDVVRWAKILAFSLFIAAVFGLAYWLGGFAESDASDDDDDGPGSWGAW